MSVELNWQTTRPSVRDRTKFMFNNDLFSDVRFEVRDAESEGKQAIPAHKFVLSIGSPVFGAMFYSELAETRDSIELPDCEYESLLELFRYMYTDEVNLSGNNVMGVLYLAKKYIVPSLAKKCANYLQDNLDASNVFSILPMANRYEEKDLVNQCWELIDEQTEAAVNSDGFITVERPLLEVLVEREYLRIEEVALFQAVDLWATNQCEKQCLAANGESKRKVLGEKLIKAIRFPVMKEKDFAAVVLDKGILTSEEVKRISEFFCSTMTSSVDFPETRRLGLLCRCHRFKSMDVEVGWLYEDGEEDYLCFTVDRGVTLHGLCLYGSKGSDYLVTVELWSTGPLLRLASQTGIFSSRLLKHKGNNYYGYPILFNPSLKLLENDQYLIKASIVGPPSCKGVDGNVFVQSCGVTFQFSSQLWYRGGTNKKQGQFPEFLFVVKNEVG